MQHQADLYAFRARPPDAGCRMAGWRPCGLTLEKKSFEVSDTLRARNILEKEFL